MRLFIVIGLLLVAALAAALFAPPYIDWNQYRAQFEAEATRYLGQPVSVDGETKVNLLPLPSVTFSDVRVGETSLGTPLVSVESFRMNVELAPLLKGDVVIVDMVMNKPVLDLRMDAQGRLDWPAAQERAGESQSVALEKLELVDGIVRFTDERTDYNVELADVDAIASARALQGPWQGSATTTSQGERYRIGFNTGLVQADGGLRVKLAVEPQSLPYDFELDGPVKLIDGVPQFDGGLAIRPMLPQQDDDLIAFRRPTVDAALPMRVEADLTMASAGATIAAFKLDVGERDDPYTISGTGQAVFGQSVFMRLQAEGQQVNVEQLEARQRAAGAGSGDASLSARVDVVRQWLRKVPRLPVDGEVKLTLPAVVLGDTTVRDVKVDIQPGESAGAWRISGFEAQLPGRTELRADGVVNVEEPFSYEGDLVVASAQPSGLATWLGAGEAGALRGMANAGFSATTRLSADQVQLDGLEIVLDGKVLTGSVLRVAGEGETRPQLTVRLAGDSVVTDQFTALLDLVSGQGEGFALASHDMEVDVQAKQIASGTVRAKDVVLKFQLSGDALSLETLDVGDLAGASLSASGALGGFPQASEGRLVGAIKGETLADFIKLAREQGWMGVALPWLESDPALTANTDMTGQIEADGDGFRLSFEGALANGEARLSVEGVDAGQPLSEQDIDASIVLENGETATLLSQLGLPTLPLDNTGRGALRLALQGTGAEGWRTDGALTLRDGYISTSGLLTVAALDDETEVRGPLDGLSGTLNVTAEAQDLDPFILLSGLPVPGFQAGNGARLSGQLKFGDGRYALDNMRGRLAGEDLSGALALDTTIRPRSEVSGALELSGLDAATLTQFVFNGGEDDSGTAPLLDGFDGLVGLTVDGLTLGAELPAVQQAKADMLIRDGELRFDNFSGSTLDGTVQGQASLSRTSTSQLAEGSLALVGASVEALAAMTGFAQGPSGDANVTMRWETAGTNRDDMLEKLTGSGVVIATDAIVPGLNTGALADVIAQIDVLDDNATEEATPTIVRDSVLSNVLPVARLEMPFTITGPLIRASNFGLEVGGLSLNGKADYGLADSTVDLSADLAYAPGLEAVAGAEPTASLSITGEAADPLVDLDSTGFATYLALRRSEAREREFAAQQAEILERQRLQRSARLYALRAETRRIQAAEKARLKELAAQQEERRRQEEARRRREELERKRLEAELQEAEAQAAREAAAEAGRRAERQQRIEELRKAAEDANRRIRESLEEF